MVAKSNAVSVNLITGILPLEGFESEAVIFTTEVGKPVDAVLLSFWLWQENNKVKGKRRKEKGIAKAGLFTIRCFLGVQRYDFQNVIVRFSLLKHLDKVIFLMHFILYINGL